MRIVDAVLHRASSVGASDRPESIWNPWCTQHPLESTSGPAIRGKPLRHRTLQLSTSRQGTRPSAERPEFPFSLGQDTQAKRRTTPCPASGSCQWTSDKFRQLFDVVAMTTRRYSVELGNAPPSKSPHWSIFRGKMKVRCVDVDEFIGSQENVKNDQNLHFD